MRIHFTPEQEPRLRAVLDRGAYRSVDEVVEAPLTAGSVSMALLVGVGLRPAR